MLWNVVVLVTPLLLLFLRKLCGENGAAFLECPFSQHQSVEKDEGTDAIDRPERYTEVTCCVGVVRVLGKAHAGVRYQ